MSDRRGGPRRNMQKIRPGFEKPRLRNTQVLSKKPNMQDIKRKKKSNK